MRQLGYVRAGTVSDKEICQTASKIHRRRYDLFNVQGNISKRANEYKTAMVNLKVILNQSCDILKQPSNKRSQGRNSKCYQKEPEKCSEGIHNMPYFLGPQDLMTKSFSQSHILPFKHTSIHPSLPLQSCLSFSLSSVLLRNLILLLQSDNSTTVSPHCATQNTETWTLVCTT